MDENNKYDLEEIRKWEMYKRTLDGGNYWALEWNIHEEKLFICEKIEEIIGYKLNGITNMYDFINIISYEEDTILAIKDLIVEVCKDKIRVLNELIKIGVNIAIDDFGTGYSSLNYLTALPVNTLKIDKSFIDNIKSENNQAVIKSIVHLSKSLKYKIITEGVETKEQVDLLTELECNIIQGYYFSKPLSESDFENLLKSQCKTLKESKVLEL